MTRQPFDKARTLAFEAAILNTCVRIVRPVFSDGLTLSNCLESDDFCDLLPGLLETPLLSRPVEPAMEAARQRLLLDLRSRGPGR